ncbi:MAG: FeoA domain-containing protein [Saprospiraceae bacterium]|nr:FeoA domain-containing protein [Saprospiraceae bacterium]
MIDTGLFLIIIVITIALFYVFLPEKGFYWKWKMAKQNNERILLEDVLKLLFNFEYRHIHCSSTDISDNLKIDDEKTGMIIERLEKSELITEKEGYLFLTDEGRKYALKIVRIHRIWERYLADETGFDSKIWHKEADRIEHFITENDANKMAAAIGNPVFDPHGDPIPSESGDIPAYVGNSLTNFQKGDYLKIIHIEDEPPLVYSQLTAMGLYPGMMLYIVSNDGNRIKFVGDGEEAVLASGLAENVTVVKINDDEYSESGKRLSSLQPGQTAYVSGLSPSCRGLERRRLMDLGVVPGTKVSVMMRSPGGEPTAYNILGAGIALRKKQADNIFIIENV